MVHSPKKGHVDAVHGRHLGSEAILTAVEREQPTLVACGRVRQCWGLVSSVGPTRVVNLGPDGVFLEI